jgi:hypothetical protein
MVPGGVSQLSAVRASPRWGDIGEIRHEGSGLDFAAEMGARLDPDLVLVQSMLAPPPLEDARRSLEYWQRRHKSLRLYQRQARREAREMALRWESRVRDAERARFDATLPGRILTALGLSGLWKLRTPAGKQRLLFLAWALTPRMVKLVAGGLVVAWLLTAVLTVALLAAAAAALG